MIPLVGNICTICANLIANGTIGKEIGANGKNGNTIGTNGTNVTNQWYHWENHEHMQCNIFVVLLMHSTFFMLVQILRKQKKKMCSFRALKNIKLQGNCPQRGFGNYSFVSDPINLATKIHMTLHSDNQMQIDKNKHWRKKWKIEF